MAPPEAGKRSEELTDSSLGRVEQLFHAACQVAPQDRDAFLRSECDDDQLRAEVAALLQYDDVQDDAFDEERIGSRRSSLGVGETIEGYRVAFTPGQVLGDYRLEEGIGRGGMAFVFRAKQLSLDRTVALKVAPMPMATDAIRTRFRREAEVGKRLRHEHIVAVYDYAEHEALQLFAMEFVDGTSLDDLTHREIELLERQPPNSPPPLRSTSYDTICRWIADAARGLAFAHGQGVIHRDVKPANLIVNREGKIKVLDFGVAKLGPGSTLTTTGALVGTPRYMSPEQLTASEVAIDHRTDIYSLGATLYELLTLHPPFESDNYGQLIAAIGSSNPIPPRQRDRRIPRALEAVCLRAMAGDREDRYQRADQLATDLENYLDGRPISVKPRSRLAGVKYKLRRNRRWGILAAACLLGLAVSIALAWQSGEPTHIRLLGERPITTERGFNGDPAISANGRWLVYASDRQASGDANVWMQQLRPDGAKQGDPFQISFEPGDETETTVSPDGRRVAYHSSGTERGIYQRTIGENGEVSEPSLVCLRGRGPRFSPDGKWLAYWIGPMGRMLTERGESIWIAPASGGAPRRIGAELVNVGYPVWSPDSQRLLFCGKAPDEATGPPDARWWVAPIDGGAAAPVDIAPLKQEIDFADELCIPFCWAPDSDYVILSGFANSRCKLWAASLAPETLRIRHLQQLTTGGSQAFYARVTQQNRICFANLEYDYGLWTAPLDAERGLTTGPLVSLADNKLSDVAPSVTTDGSRMVFTSDRDGDADIYLVSDDSRITRLIGGEGDDGNQLYAVISADGQRIAYLQGSAEEPDDDFALYVADLHDQPHDPTLVAANMRALGSKWSMPLDWHPTSPSRQLMIGNNGVLELVDTETGSRATLLSRSGVWIGQARFAPNGKWIAFVVGGQVFVVPYRLRSTVAADWIPITDGKSGDAAPAWSPDGDAIYFLSDRDGRQGVWRQLLDPTMHATGLPQHVHAFSEFRLSPVAVGSHLRPLTVWKDRLLFCLSQYSGDVLVADLVVR